MRYTAETIVISASQLRLKSHHYSSLLNVAEDLKDVVPVAAHEIAPSVRDSSVEVIEPAVAIRLGKSPLVSDPEASIAEAPQPGKGVPHRLLAQLTLPHSRILKLDHLCSTGSLAHVCIA